MQTRNQSEWKRALRLPLHAKTLLLGFLVAGALVGCASVPVPSQKNLALIQASRTGDKDEVLALLRDGADINAQDPDGWTPYLAASSEGKWEIMHILQGMGCKTDPGF
jgi:ankyrin repeat protein